jgi:MscS family membrane protein
MNSFLNRVILDNTILVYLICIGTILMVLIFKRYVSRYLAQLIFKLLSRALPDVDQKIFVKLLVKPMETFLMIFVTLVTIDKLKFPRLFEIDIVRGTAKTFLSSISTTILIVAFIWLLLRMIDFIAALLQKRADLTPDLTDNQLIVFFKDFFKVVLILIGILLVIKFTFQKDIGTLLAGFGIVAGALALAARESLENLIASFIIFFDKPFHIGDVVKVNQITGSVERIGLRSTRIRTDQKTYVTVPNKQMVDSIMDNLTLRTQRRVDLDLQVSLGTAAVQLQELLDGIKKILDYPAIENRTLFLNDIVTNAYIIHVEYYTGAIPIAEFNGIKQRTNLEIIKLMESLKIELAGLNTEVKVSGRLDEYRSTIDEVQSTGSK